MNDIQAWLAILAGILVRLAVPILITVMAVYILRILDARWQAENKTHVIIDKPKCWEVHGCTPEQRAHCEAASSKLPCWQVKRLPNGYLRDECLDCRVFIEAPAPIRI